MKRPAVLIGLCLPLLTACVSGYWQITDVDTGHVYETRLINHGHGGAIGFRDQTGAWVVLNEYSYTFVRTPPWKPSKRTYRRLMDERSQEDGNKNDG